MPSTNMAQRWSSLRLAGRNRELVKTRGVWSCELGHDMLNGQPLRLEH